MLSPGNYADGLGFIFSPFIRFRTNLRDPRDPVFLFRGAGRWRGGHVQTCIHEQGDQYTKRLDVRTDSTPSFFPDFVDSIIEKRPPLATGDHGRKVMKVIEGIYRCAESGKEVRYRKG